MTVTVITGNIFTTKCQTIVNTVNCVGVMGAGIALECRLRYPEMYDKYVHQCTQKQVKIGSLWIYKGTDRWILNFPTKQHWRYPSKIDYLRAGLEKFLNTYAERDLVSVAFPILGADKGGIPQDRSLEIMKTYLSQANIDIEIYKYDSNATDDLYEKTRELLESLDIENVAKSTGIGKNQISKVIAALRSPEIVQLNQLATVDGVGIKTLEKLFQFARSWDPKQQEQ